MYAEFGIERELQNGIQIIEYENGNGDFHFHSQIEICLVDEGELDVLVNNKRHRLQGGEISVALSYHTHVYKPIYNSKFTILIIPTASCEKFMQEIRGKSITSPFLSGESANEIKEYFAKIKNEKINELKKIGYVNLILGVIAESVDFGTSDFELESELLSKILLHIHENYKSDISLSSLSHLFGYSESYISRYFKSCFNIGVNRYLNITRLKNAIMLLKSGKYTTTYCALESGFNSLRTFYRVFQSEFHTSPNEYLKG